MYKVQVVLKSGASVEFEAEKFDEVAGGYRWTNIPGDGPRLASLEGSEVAAVIKTPVVGLLGKRR